MTDYTQMAGEVAENYERFFVPSIGGPLGKQLVELADLRSGERVLDAGCGTGLIARLAVERVGIANVTAVDITPAMLAVARRTVPLPASAWHEASIEAIPLADASVDVAICQLVLQFVNDKAAALKELRRVLAPAGRLLLSTVGPTPPLFAIMEAALVRHLGPGPGAFVKAVFSMSDPDVLRDLALAAGFSEANVTTRRSILHLPPPEEFLSQYINSTPLAMAMAQGGDEMRRKIAADVVPAWQDLARGGALECPVDMRILTARA